MKILKVGMMLVFLFFVATALYKVSAQESPSKEGAVEILNVMIEDVDTTIQNLDSIIAEYTKEKIIFVELRIRLEIARDMEVEKEESLELRGATAGGRVIRDVMKKSLDNTLKAIEGYIDAKETIETNTYEAEERLRQLKRNKEKLEQIYPIKR